MKTTPNTASPFILLLIPALFCALLMYVNTPKESDGKLPVGTTLHKSPIKAIFSSIL